MKWIPWLGLTLTVLFTACDDGSSSTPGQVDGGVPLDAELSDAQRLDGRPTPDGAVDGGADMMPQVDGGEDGDAFLDDGGLGDGGLDGDVPDGGDALPADMMIRCHDELNPCPPLPNGRPQRCDEASGLCVEDEPPAAEPIDLRLLEDGQVDVLLRGSDPAGQPVRFEVVDGPVRGRLEGEAPALVYVPEPDAFGEDSFTYVAIDSPAEQASQPARVTLTIDPVNDPPVITDQAALHTPEDTQLTVTLAHLVVTDDGPLEALTVEVLLGERYTAEGATLTPEADYFGPLTVNVRVVDGEDEPSAPYPLVVQVDPVNDPPRIVGQAPVSTPEDTPFTPTLADVTVVDDGADAGTLQVLPGEGYTVDEDGQVTPAPDFAGELSVNVVVVDADGVASAPFALTVTVTPVNDPPRVDGLDPSPVTVLEDEALVLEARFFVVTDEDPEGLAYEAQPGANYQVDDQGRVVPDPDFTGQLQVPVVVVDADGLRSEPVVLVVHVLEVGDPPVIAGQVSLATTPEDTPFTVALADLDVSDVDSDPALLTVRALPGEGYTVDGAQITPPQDFSGLLTVPVVVNDGAADSAPFDFQLDVLPVNDPPRIVGAGDPVLAREDTPVALALANLQIEDPDSDAFTLQVLPGDRYVVEGGQVIPEADFDGALVINVQVTDDAEAASAPFGLEVALTPVNDPPAAPDLDFDDLVANAPFRAPAGTLLAGATDVEGDALSATAAEVDTEAGGRVVVAEDGSFTYEGPLGGLAPDAFEFEVRDAQGAATVATVRLATAHRVWFVEALALGEGRLTDPLGSLPQAAALAEAGDVIFVKASESQLTAGERVILQAGVQVVGEAAGLILGRNLALPPGERPTVVGAPELFELASNVSVRGLRVTADFNVFHGAGIGDVSLSDLVIAQGAGDLLRIEDLRGPVALAGCHTEDGARIGGIALRGGEPAGRLALNDLDLAIQGNAVFASNLDRLDGAGVVLRASGGAALDLMDVRGMALNSPLLESVGSFSTGLSLTNVTGTLDAAEVRLNEAFEGGLVAQDGAPQITLGQLTVTGGFNAVRFNSPDGQLTVGEPGDEAAFVASLLDESVMWARAGDITVHGLRADQRLGLGIQVPTGADLAQLTVAGARFDGLFGHALLVGEDGEAFETTTVRSVTLSDWVVSAPQASVIHLNGVADSVLAVDGLAADQFAPDVDGITGWGAGQITLAGLALGDLSGVADGVRLIGEGALTVRITGGSILGAGGDNAVRLVGDGRPTTADFAVVGVRIAGWLGDRISLDAGDGDTAAVLRADDNTIEANDPPGFGAGIRLLLEADIVGATLTGTLSAQGNTITGPGSHGVDVTLRDAAASTADVLIIDNDVNQVGGEAIRLRALDGAQVRAAIRDNRAGEVGGGGLLILADDPAQVAVEGAGEDAAAALEAQNEVVPVVVPAGLRVIPVGSVQP